MMRRTMSSRQGSTASTFRAVSIASAKSAFRRASDDAFGETAQIRVAMPLANGVEPLVVDLGQQVAAIEFDRFGRADCDRCDASTNASTSSQTSASGFHATFRRRRRRNRSAGCGSVLQQFAQRRAQLRARGALFVVGVEQEREVLARHGAARCSRGRPGPAAIFAAS